VGLSGFLGGLRFSAFRGEASVERGCISAYCGSAAEWVVYTQQLREARYLFIYLFIMPYGSTAHMHLKTYTNTQEYK